MPKNSDSEALFKTNGYFLLAIGICPCGQGFIYLESRALPKFYKVYRCKL